MRTDDTKIGGVRTAFPGTTWSVLENLRKKSESEFRKGVEVLCRRYWKPIYGYIRTRWAKNVEDAKDITQAFFLWLVEGDGLEKFDPDRGSFRSYLKVLLGGFVAHEHRALRSQKRGGGKATIPLQLEDESELSLTQIREADPERAFDLAWVSEVIRLSLDRVRQNIESEGRSILMRVYEDYELHNPEEKRTYGEVATRLGIRENDVRSHLATVREMLREEIRIELMGTTNSLKKREEEWNELFPS